MINTDLAAILGVFH